MVLVFPPGILYDGVPLSAPFINACVMMHIWAKDGSTLHTQLLASTVQHDIMFKFSFFVCVGIDDLGVVAKGQ